MITPILVSPIDVDLVIISFHNTLQARVCIAVTFDTSLLYQHIPLRVPFTIDQSTFVTRNLEHSLKQFVWCAVFFFWWRSTEEQHISKIRKGFVLPYKSEQKTVGKCMLQPSVPYRFHYVCVWIRICIWACLHSGLMWAPAAGHPTLAPPPDDLCRAICFLCCTASRSSA